MIDPDKNSQVKNITKGPKYLQQEPKQEKKECVPLAYQEHF